jgi:pyruvate-formate lyase-activating enzyme
VTAAGALEAVERVLNRGGEPADVIAAVVDALDERGFATAIRTRGGVIGDAPAASAEVPVESGGAVVGAVRLAGDDALAARVATLISPYVASV